MIYERRDESVPRPLVAIAKVQSTLFNNLRVNLTRCKKVYTYLIFSFRHDYRLPTTSNFTFTFRLAIPHSAIVHPKSPYPPGTLSTVYTFIHGRYRGYENPYPFGIAAALHFDIPAWLLLRGTRSSFNGSRFVSTTRDAVDVQYSVFCCQFSFFYLQTTSNHRQTTFHPRSASSSVLLTPFFLLSL